LSNWVSSVDGVTSVAGSALKLSFVMRTNLILTANFITNEFIAVAGAYNGLFNDPVTGPALRSAGLFTLNTDTNRNFSGKLYLDGRTNSFAGVLDLLGTGISRPVLRQGKNPLSVVIMLDLQGGSDVVLGRVNCVADGWSALLAGDRAVLKLNTNLAAPYVGAYTMVLPHPLSQCPGGDGYTTINVSARGALTASGLLGDAQPLRPVPATVSKNGYWPFYATAYRSISPTGVQKYYGLAIGWLCINNDPSRRITGDIAWIKVAFTNGYYNDGFTNNIPVLGAPYTINTNRLLNLTNGVVILTGGNLSQTLTNSFTLAPGNKIVNVSTNYAFQLAVKPGTGRFTGSFKHPDHANIVTAFSGVVLQDQVVGFGVFKGTNQTGSIFLQRN
jgi:hypothetical protein